MLSKFNLALSLSSYQNFLLELQHNLDFSFSYGRFTFSLFSCFVLKILRFLQRPNDIYLLYFSQNFILNDKILIVLNRGATEGQYFVDYCVENETLIARCSYVNKLIKKFELV